MAKINIRNLNRSRKIPSAKLKKILGRISTDLGIRGAVNFRIVSDRSILQYNRRYLQHDYVTDVIAFEGLGEVFGDIVISSDTAARQAREQGHSFEKELTILMLHGTLHLLGYRDKTKTERARMWRKTYALLKQPAGRS